MVKIAKKGKKKFYITTAIDYVNAKPHLGHAYEKILADIIARWHRFIDEDVFFLTGTDENAQKNEQAAKKAGIETKKFVDKNAQLFVQLCKKLNISNDDFIRTTEERHIKASQLIFKKLFDKGEIYKGHYEGLYCYGCENYITEKDLVDGKCSMHDKEPEWIKEEAYFFKMSKYTKKIIKFLEKKNSVLPEGRRKEMFNRVKEEGLKDLCVSRSNLNWGVKVPFDEKHRIYVWIDALSNYVTALGYPSDKKFKKFWPADCHLIGKDINWFHSVIWPAILIASDIEPPKTVFVHGFVNIKGSKMSKSTGLVVDPIELVEKYGLDSVRYFFARNIPFGYDGDFSYESLIERYNGELADKLGNLVSRVVGLAEKYLKSKIKKKKSDEKLFKNLKLDLIKKQMENYEINKALTTIFEFIDFCNNYIQEKKPWELTKTNMEEFENIIYNSLDAIRIIALLLHAFIPNASDRILTQLNLKTEKTIDNCKPGLLKETKLNKKEILFAKIEDGK
ncbi:methionine--tRNA ligase [Candidatus Pacearchaeota archaeon CG1_02_31_27]|nr:MAG: methionine--tRNA ligase [Candidatus Pacearchaeota archaeon CG1_02_31_27]PIN92250.1 MAG: methionine--tRNA ligase [Candidatus Pacearchaeota archaeon CG10_big_fil_rev_8_21_14_0_10_31_59]PIZ81224.1 MAG: methionine--tRNA ligase [Candidatus Pacearchaeota archaeon CG_4_10_14_0_2_um_filter_31_10]